MAKMLTTAFSTFVGCIITYNYENVKRRAFCPMLFLFKEFYRRGCNMNENLTKSDRVGFENLDKNQPEKLYIVKEVALMVGETSRVLRHWMDALGEYIPTQKGDSSGYNLFDEKAVEVVRKIKKMNREQGYSMKQIEHYFATGGEEFAPISEPTNEIKDDINEIKELLRQQMEFNQALVQRMDQQQEYIEQSIKQRDEQLMTTIRALQDNKKRKWFHFGREK